MKRGLIHRIQSNIFSDWPYSFIDPEQIIRLADDLADDIRGYDYDLIIGLSSGGDFPAQYLSKLTGIPNSPMRVSHYSIEVGPFEIEDVVGAYRLARMLGYRRETKIRSTPNQSVHGKRLLVVDDDSYSGSTLRCAINFLSQEGAVEIRTGVLMSHDKSEYVDYAGKLYPHDQFYRKRYRFPWARLSPYFDEFYREVTSSLEPCCASGRSH